MRGWCQEFRIAVKGWKIPVIAAAVVLGVSLLSSMLLPCCLPNPFTFREGVSEVEQRSPGHALSVSNHLLSSAPKVCQSVCRREFRVGHPPPPSLLRGDCQRKTQRAKLPSSPPLPFRQPFPSCTPSPFPNLNERFWKSS
jgi:hypothetical protein